MIAKNTIIKIIKLYNEKPAFYLDSNNYTQESCHGAKFIKISIFKDSKLQFTMKTDDFNIHSIELMDNLIAYSIDIVSKNSNKILIFKTPFLYPPPLPSSWEK
ncbi:MAG: hypothetical protein QM539_10860 [Alphaproteobacteria bacterium]|nr:hypothetical protein [Alphaproteobacteria bacterium]